MACTEPLTVVVPTIGRLDLLRACLTSILACEPPPDEVIVVDQSGGPGVSALIESLASSRLRRVPSDGRGIAAATNCGIRGHTSARSHHT